MIIKAKNNQKSSWPMQAGSDPFAIVSCLAEDASTRISLLNQAEIVIQMEGAKIILLSFHMES